MALSYSFDFTLNRNALITRALRMIGAIAANQEPTAAEISDASESLNLMLKAWQADGMQLWTVTMTTFTPESGIYGPPACVVNLCQMGTLLAPVRI